VSDSGFPFSSMPNQPVLSFPKISADGSGLRSRNICIAFAPAFLALTLGGLWLSSQTTLAEESFAAIAADVQKVFESAKGAVVRIESEDQHGRLAGTGFVIDPAGIIYTAYSVAGESSDIIVELGVSRYPAERLVADSRSGVAILKIHTETPFLPVGDSDELAIASPVVTIGYPQGLPLTPNYGIVGGLDQGDPKQPFATTLIRANVPPQKGEGGAPLLNLKGEVIGILISSVDNKTACYALPIRAAEKIRADYVRFGEVRPGWVGVNIEDGDKEYNQSRVVITGFEDNSPATEIGLQPGDILMQVGSVKIHSIADVRNASFFLSADQKVSISVYRDGRNVTFDVIPSLPQQPRFPVFAPGYLLNGDNALRLKLEN
jgi:S1-C subfamily serine protease